jgi:hypothetical protein
MQGCFAKLSRKTRSRRTKINDLPGTVFFITFGGPQAHEDLSMTGLRIWATTFGVMCKTGF